MLNIGAAAYEEAYDWDGVGEIKKSDAASDEAGMQ
jgi:hypothetical protein